MLCIISSTQVFDSTTINNCGDINMTRRSTNSNSLFDFDPARNRNRKNKQKSLTSAIANCPINGRVSSPYACFNNTEIKSYQNLLIATKLKLVGDFVHKPKIYEVLIPNLDTEMGDTPYKTIAAHGVVEFEDIWNQMAGRHNSLIKKNKKIIEKLKRHTQEAITDWNKFLTTVFAIAPIGSAIITILANLTAITFKIFNAVFASEMKWLDAFKLDAEIYTIIKEASETWQTLSILDAVCNGIMLSAEMINAIFVYSVLSAVCITLINIYARQPFEGVVENIVLKEDNTSGTMHIGESTEADTFTSYAVLLDASGKEKYYVIKNAGDIQKQLESVYEMTQENAGRSEMLQTSDSEAEENTLVRVPLLTQ